MSRPRRVRKPGGARSDRKERIGLHPSRCITAMSRIGFGIATGDCQQDLWTRRPQPARGGCSGVPTVAAWPRAAPPIFDTPGMVVATCVTSQPAVRVVISAAQNGQRPESAGSAGPPHTRQTATDPDTCVRLSAGRWNSHRSCQVRCRSIRGHLRGHRLRHHVGEPGHHLALHLRRHARCCRGLVGGAADRVQLSQLPNDAHSSPPGPAKR